MSHEINGSSVPAGGSNGNPFGSCFGSGAGESGSGVVVGSLPAALLLPLREGKWREALHENVRTAAIPESVVGSNVPQENFGRNSIIVSRTAGGLTEDKPERAGADVRVSPQSNPNDFFPPVYSLSPSRGSAGSSSPLTQPDSRISQKQLSMERIGNDDDGARVIFAPNLR